MGESEISYVDTEMKKGIDNLGKILNEWSAAPSMKKQMKKSKGYTPREIENNIDITIDIDKTVEKLLSNSINFFNALGDSFNNVDEKNAYAIQGGEQDGI